MKIPPLKPLKNSQFPDLGWFPRLSSPINSFMQEIINGLNKKLTFKENMDCEIKEVIIDGSYPVKTSWERDSKPTGLWMTNIRRVDGADTNLSEGITIEWSYSNGVININNVVGLSASATDKYTLTIIAITN